MNTQTFSQKSNAARAAVKAGFTRQDIAPAERPGFWVVSTPWAATAKAETPATLAAAPAPSAPQAATGKRTALRDTATVWFTVDGDNEHAAELAAKVARILGRDVGLTMTVAGATHSMERTIPAPAKPVRAAKATRTPRAERDYTVKPIITSESNKALQAIMDRIDAARGDEKALLALDTFKRSSTYYKMAGRFLDALLMDARIKAKG